MNIQLVVGDWSKDGHNQYDSYTAKIAEGFNEKDVEVAYNLASNKLKFNLTKEACNEFEDNILNKMQIEKLSIIPQFKVFNLEKDDNDDLNVSSEDFAQLYCLICNYGNENLCMELVEQEIPKLNIGGYGCFYL